MTESLPPLNTLTTASLEDYVKQLEAKEAVATAQGNTSEARFDQDVIEGCQLQIDIREHPQNRQHDQAIELELYNDEISLYQANPQNASNL